MRWESSGGREELGRWERGMVYVLARRGVADLTGGLLI